MAQAVKIEDIARYRFLSDVQMSPNGDRTAFVVKQGNVKENDYTSNIHVREGRRTYRLTNSGKDEKPRWSPDGKCIYFISRRNKDPDSLDVDIFTEIFRIEVGKGEAEMAFKVPYPVGAMEFVDDSTLLLQCRVDTSRPLPHEMGKRDIDSHLKALKEDRDYTTIDEIPFWYNGMGNTNKLRWRLFTAKIPSGKLTMHTEGLLDVVELDIRGKTVVFRGIEWDGHKPLETDIYRMELGGRPEKITKRSRYFLSPRFIGDREVIVAVSDIGKFGVNTNPDFHLLDIRSGKLKQITRDLDLSLWASVGSDVRLGEVSLKRVDGNWLYFISTKDHHCHLFRIDRDGNVKTVVEGEGSVDTFDVRDGVVHFVALRGLNLQELYSSVEGKLRRLTDLNSRSLSGRSVCEPEHLVVGKRQLDTWIIRPPGFNPKKKYPAIFEIHGGPKTVYSDVFYHEFQVLANRGYVVFYCNPRGGDGKGNAFMDIFGDYGGRDFLDLMEVLDGVLERFDFIDKTRLGVTGGSYGGFMTNWIIGKTDRFKAAVSQRSIASWDTMFLTSDIGFYFAPDQVRGDPWKGRKKSWEQSPIRLAPNVKTPTLFIHSDRDLRCWHVEGIQMLTALRYHGVESRLVLFHGENHELSRGGKPLHRMRRLREIADWFDRYLK